MAHLFHHNKDAKSPQDELKQHKRHAHIGEGVGLSAGVGALYEKHQAKKDVEHAHRHKIEEVVAATGAVLAGGYVFHEHHEKKDAKKEVKAEKKDHKKEVKAEKKHHF